MKKSILYGMVTLAVLFGLIFLVGISNRYFMFYDVKVSHKNTNKNNNNNNNGDNKPGKSDKNIKGYACKTDECKMLDGTDVINDKFVFVLDDDNKIYLYNMEKDAVTDTYIEVTPTDKLYIVAGQDGMYGLIKIDNDVEKVYDLKYSYIQYNEDDHNFMVTSPTSSFITDADGKKISSDYSAQIMQYSDKYIVTKTKNNDYHVFSMNNKEYLTEYINSKSVYIEILGDYVGVVDTNNNYKVYDFTNYTKVIGEYKASDDKMVLRGRINGNSIEIYDELSNEVVKTLEI